MARPVLRPSPCDRVARPRHALRCRGPGGSDGPRLPADGLVPRDGRVGAPPGRSAKARARQARPRAARRRRRGRRPAARRLLAYLPGEVPRGSGHLLEDAPPVGRGPWGPGASPARRPPHRGAGRALAGPGQRRLLARGVRRLLSAAPPSCREERPPRVRAPSRRVGRPAPTPVDTRGRQRRPAGGGLRENAGAHALRGPRGEPLGCTTRAVGGAIAVTFTRGAEAPVSVEKAVTIREATVEVRYRLTAPAATPVAGRWAVQWNLALTAGDAPG